MTKSVVCILIAILVYMSMMVVIGAVYSKRTAASAIFIWAAGGSDRWFLP